MPNKPRDEWINLTVPEISTSGDESAFGPPVNLERQTPAPAPAPGTAVPAQIAGNEPMLPAVQVPADALPIAPWKRNALLIGGAGVLLAAVVYVPKWWKRRRRKR